MHTNKLCNLDEMDNLGICDVRKTQKLPSLNHEKTDWMSRIMTSRDWISSQKSPVKEKPEAWWPHWWIPPNISKRTNTNPQIVPDIKEKEQFLTHSMWPALSWYQSQTKTQENY